MLSLVMMGTLSAWDWVIAFHRAQSIVAYLLRGFGLLHTLTAGSV
jgi:hypothetical protein